MQDLRAHLRHTRPVEREASVGSLDLELEEEDPLTELGWRIYKRASIPNSPQPSSSSSFQDYPNQPREPRSTSPKPPGFNMPHPVRSEISSRQTSPEPPDPPPDTGPALSSESFSEPPSFKKTSRHKQGHGVKSTNGYVQNPSGDMRWHQTTASLVEFLPGNIISIRKAKELDLEIETLTLPEDATLDFGTGAPEKISGKTTFKWKAWDYIKPPYPPLTITCDVCENSTVGLILGKPFLEERKRCWSREEARSS
ncbi:uncharacterized protein B0H64DRAFT_122288 [Chaetomium fimeti]|uniref:Uncharacterized protein n=1 Tax=Chaetomium fimeti TaxID=1854472 RepID=A0AAE0LTT3_9PEZI|nr:hypothetical protein B0H64DRAFT_122288 [Chaetomium fimeti]